MNLDQFAELVAKMRSLQKEYFRTRNSLTLEAAKRTEKQVDKELIQLVKPAATTQKSLF